MASIIDRRGFDDAVDGFNFQMQGATEQAPLFFSIWHSQRLKHVSKEADPNQAEAEFTDILRVWQRNAMGGTLEVRFHEQKPSGNINNKTPYVGSFTFSLHQWENQRDFAGSYTNGNGGQVSTVLQKILDRLEALERKQEAGQVGSDVEDNWDKWQRRIESFLSHPTVDDMIIGFGRKYLKLDMNRERENYPGMAGDADADGEEIVLGIPQSQQDRLNAALAVIADGEPKWIELLEKLAELKRKKPMQYNMAKSFLK